MAGFEQECGKHAKKLGIRCSKHIDAKEAVRQYLTLKGAGNWLLIVYDVDNMEIFDKSTFAGGGILDFLPYNGDGRILFTTRSKQVALTAPRTAESLIDEDELHGDEKVVELPQTLTYLPLTITQAAAYMNTYEASITADLRISISTEILALISISR
ncbi:hypothetical protein FOPG_19202 [Fusarium oxysporum f. sp. conglutinans race 2 54008]|uniref:NB-ARC domain-containing protein n=1 Tax=Fusarium oxysporum f. sp. conglutinans race 2 54008 TaxID=1089457 RepID=X0GMM5_FUSOX|nr:hypothetical protein FOPG_19202 [Fusarium oxysporum f. sp. conglutinans race 2 54008]